MGFPKVEVSFLDARTERELYEEDLEKIHDTIYNAIGYLIKENETYLFIAQSILPKNDDFDSTVFRNVIIIPKVSIIKKVELKE